MLLPTSELAVLLLLGLSVVAWGSWTSLFTVAKKWRFELFYYDFALGFLLAAVIAAFTLGSWDPKDLTFQDNFLLAGRRYMVWVLGSGLLLGIANLLLLASSTLSGPGVAFTAAFGLLLAGNTVWELAVNRNINLVLASGGIGLAVVAAIGALVGYRWRLAHQENAETQAALAELNLKKNLPTRSSGAAGPFLAVVAGLLLIPFFRTLANGTISDGVAPYGALLLLGAGVLGATIVVVPFFLYFPVRGGGLQVRHYFKGNWLHHFLGLCGGILGGVAVLSFLLAKGAPANLQVAPILRYFLYYGAPVVAALWGMFAGREFVGGGFRGNVIFLVSMVLLLASMGMIAVSTV